MKLTAGAVEGGHILLTGPIQGVVELADGRVVDVSPAFIEINDDEAEEISHRIGLRHMNEGHPSLIERDDDPDSDSSGEMVQRPFHYIPPESYHGDVKGQKPYGTPRKGTKPDIHPDHSKGFAPAAEKTES